MLPGGAIVAATSGVMAFEMEIVEQLLSLPRPAKRAIALTVDAILCALCVHIAFFLRTNSWADPFGPMLYPVIISISLALPIFVISGLYRAIFRYSGGTALLAIAKAVAIYATPFATIYSVIGFPSVPRTIGLIQPILLVMFVAGSRGLVSQVLGKAYVNAVAKADMPQLLIYGAGASGRQLASALNVSGQVNVVGFLDDDPTLWKATINGLRVYSPDRISNLVERHNVTDILLAINKASRNQRSAIIALLKGSGLHVRTMPGVDQLARGIVSLGDMRDLDIEDLLGRDPIPPNAELLARNVTGKVVMVTGAGGSIGSEICRQVARLRPDVLLMVEASEYGLYAIHQELQRDQEDGIANAGALVPLLANIRDRSRIDEILAAWKPHSIYHAAAYKHVPLVEHNLLEGVLNNVFGTLNLALAANESAVESFVLISTDKAVRPTNVMGATKRLSEIILQALHDRGTTTKFSMVRFGNVLGSSGSVVPLFRRQLASGGPLTVTNAEMTRYFMTIPEAAQLVIQAGAMANGGDVFVLDMGEPVKIIDLARSMIELSGLKVRESGSDDGDIAIEIVGMRPGEKLYEELLIGNDPLQSAHPRILRAQEPLIVWSDLEKLLDHLKTRIEARDPMSVREQLRELVIEFEQKGDLVDFVVLRRELTALTG
jgi:FlaA1/EpsC-like NDP-sugar epimerase